MRPLINQIDSWLYFASFFFTFWFYHFPVLVFTFLTLGGFSQPIRASGVVLSCSDNNLHVHGQAQTMSPKETENRNGDSIAVEPTFPHNEVTNLFGRKSSWWRRPSRHRRLHIDLTLQSLNSLNEKIICLGGISSHFWMGEYTYEVCIIIPYCSA